MRWILFLTLMASCSLWGCGTADDGGATTEYQTVSLEVTGMS